MKIAAIVTFFVVPFLLSAAPLAELPALEPFHLVIYGAVAGGLGGLASAMRTIQDARRARKSSKLLTAATTSLYMMVASAGGSLATMFWHSADPADPVKQWATIGAFGVCSLAGFEFVDWVHSLGKHIGEARVNARIDNDDQNEK